MRCRIGAHLAAAEESDQRDKQDHDREEEQQEQKQHVQQKIAEEAALPVSDVASDPQDDKDELNGNQDDGSPDASSFIQMTPPNVLPASGPSKNVPKKSNMILPPSLMPIMS